MYGWVYLYFISVLDNFISFVWFVSKYNKKINKKRFIVVKEKHRFKARLIQPYAVSSWKRWNVLSPCDLIAHQSRSKEDISVRAHSWLLPGRSVPSRYPPCLLVHHHCPRMTHRRSSRRPSVHYRYHHPSGVVRGDALDGQKFDQGVRTTTCTVS